MPNLPPELNSNHLMSHLRTKFVIRSRRAKTFVAMMVLVCAGRVFAQDAKNKHKLFERGRTVYRKTCTSCHGDQGQGVADAYEEPLVGDKTVGELTTLIAETMPEGESAKCVGEDADAVARFVHYSF